MNTEAILAALGFIQKLQPIVDAEYQQLEALVPVEKADVAALVAAGKKAWEDNKAGVQKLIDAFNAAKSGTPPAAS